MFGDVFIRFSFDGDSSSVHFFVAFYRSPGSTFGSMSFGCCSKPNPMQFNESRRKPMEYVFLHSNRRSTSPLDRIEGVLCSNSRGNDWSACITTIGNCTIHIIRIICELAIEETVDFFNMKSERIMFSNCPLLRGKCLQIVFSSQFSTATQRSWAADSERNSKSECRSTVLGDPRGLWTAAVRECSGHQQQLI